MGTTYNIYCDESCHLEHDHINTMALGAIWCPDERVPALAVKLRELKRAFGLSASFEIKWTKVSPAKVEFYKAVINFFFDEPSLRFRGVSIPDKGLLDHAAYDQDHDTWYYKMWFILLDQIMTPDNTHNIYLDIKDTRSQEKVIKLRDVLRSSNHDKSAQIINCVQQVRSHEVELLQIADLFAGALTYLGRGLKSSEAKLELIREIQNKVGMSLERSTLPDEEKFNHLVWRP